MSRRKEPVIPNELLDLGYGQSSTNQYLLLQRPGRSRTQLVLATFALTGHRVDGQQAWDRLRRTGYGGQIDGPAAPFAFVRTETALMVLAVAQRLGVDAIVLAAIAAIFGVAFNAISIVVTVGLTLPRAENADRGAAQIDCPRFGTINIIGTTADGLDLKVDHSGVGIRIAGGSGRSAPPAAS